MTNLAGPVAWGYILTTIFTQSNVLPCQEAGLEIDHPQITYKPGWYLKWFFYFLLDINNQNSLFLKCFTPFLSLLHEICGVQDKTFTMEGENGITLLTSLSPKSEAWSPESEVQTPKSEFLDWGCHNNHMGHHHHPTRITFNHEGGLKEKSFSLIPSTNPTTYNFLNWESPSTLGCQWGVWSPNLQFGSLYLTSIN